MNHGSFVLAIKPWHVQGGYKSSENRILIHLSILPPKSVLMCYEDGTVHAVVCLSPSGPGLRDIADPPNRERER